ncbi:hypothetical protein M9H77_23773 [Catharanthus roseus]|uniref:Uncharacterized protein n=1 Tax=Catharanthus roseus TaxID=4058 RepID=A0ACC0AU96_CATRO|nr:hypothetical protein M9H77_23773 [Catharanthus roseus]
MTITSARDKVTTVDDQPIMMLTLGLRTPHSSTYETGSSTRSPVPRIIYPTRGVLHKFGGGAISGRGGGEQYEDKDWKRQRMRVRRGDDQIEDEYTQDYDNGGPRPASISEFAHSWCQVLGSRSGCSGRGTGYSIHDYLGCSSRG